MKCKHPNCSNNKLQRDEALRSELQLCKFHENEFIGKSDWSCSWCDAQHEQAMNLIEDQQFRWGGER